MNAEPLEERTVLEVVRHLRIIRIRIPFDLTCRRSLCRLVLPTATNSVSRPTFVCPCQPQTPFAVQPMPVPTGNPLAGLMRMSAFGPAPECLPQSLFHLPIRPRRYDVTVVVYPTLNDRVELTNQFRLAESPALTNQPSRLAQEGMRILLGRFPSLVPRPRPCRKTSRSAAVAGLSPCSSGCLSCLDDTRLPVS